MSHRWCCHWGHLTCERQVVFNCKGHGILGLYTVNVHSSKSTTVTCLQLIEIVRSSSLKCVVGPITPIVLF